MKLTVATCQFPVSDDVAANARHIKRQMRAARARGADVAHFCECALSGYAGSDFADYGRFDWPALSARTEQIIELAGNLGLWLVLGSTHPLSGGHKPHNSLYIVSDQGVLVDRYDKLFCAGDKDATAGDLAHYSPGSHFSTFVINGVRCGAQICHDYRYPELYREYQRRDVQLMFHSFHAGNMTPERLELMKDYIGRDHLRLNGNPTIAGMTQLAAMQTAAASNYVFISCPNTCAPLSCWPSFFVRPDGVITGRLRPHRPGVLITTVDTEQEYYDSTAAWRDNAINGVFHSGQLVDDHRSRERTTL